MEQSKRWHIAPLRFLAWVESIVKILAFVAAYLLAWWTFAGQQTPTAPSGLPMIVATSITGLLILGLVAGVYDRILEREIFAFGFIFFNILAHAAFLYALLANPDGSGRLVFPVLMLIGDCIKIIEIRRYHMHVREFNEGVLYGLTGFYILGYILLIVCILL